MLTGNSMAVREMALALRMLNPKIAMRVGTNTTPPPIPKKPERIPVINPKTNNPISMESIERCIIKKENMD